MPNLQHLPTRPEVATASTATIWPTMAITEATIRVILRHHPQQEFRSTPRHVYQHYHGHVGLPTQEETSVDKSGSGLYVTPSETDKNYAVHVRASPISPTYSQFSHGVSVKNCYPPLGRSDGNSPTSSSQATAKRYQAGSVDSASSSNTLRHQIRKDDIVSDNYSVYVNCV